MLGCVECQQSTEWVVIIREHNKVEMANEANISGFEFSTSKYTYNGNLGASKNMEDGTMAGNEEYHMKKRQTHIGKYLYRHDKL